MDGNKHVMRDDLHLGTGKAHELDNVDDAHELG